MNWQPQRGRGYYNNKSNGRDISDLPLKSISYDPFPNVPKNVDLILTFDKKDMPVYTELKTSVTPLIIKPEVLQYDNDMLLLLQALPENLKQPIWGFLSTDPRQLVEVVVDLGRPPVLWFSDGTNIQAQTEITETDIAVCLGALLNGEKQWTSDNRIGLSRTLHRISAIKNRVGKIVGLTYRIGRHIPGVAQMIRDCVASVGAQKAIQKEGEPFGTPSKPASMLLMGPPGTGKTTLLRDVSRFLSSEVQKRVMVIDTSNEIGGDGDSAHVCIGDARRMQVPSRESQFSVMLEAVQNHTPEIIIIDEIGTSKEVESARTISQRGVSLVATAHGLNLSSLLKNPTLLPLVGGVHPVIVSDRLAQSQPGRFQKSRLERKGAPTFDVVVELVNTNNWRIYKDVGNVIDRLLDPSTGTLWVENRWTDERGVLKARFTPYASPSTKIKDLREVSNNFEFSRVSTSGNSFSGESKSGMVDTD